MSACIRGCMNTCVHKQVWGSISICVWVCLWECVCVSESSAVWSRGPALSETGRQSYSRITADIWADWDLLKTCPYCWDWYNEINRCGGGHTHTRVHIETFDRHALRRLTITHAQRLLRGTNRLWRGLYRVINAHVQKYTNAGSTHKHIWRARMRKQDPQLHLHTNTLTKPRQKQHLNDMCT